MSLATGHFGPGKVDIDLTVSGHRVIADTTTEKGGENKAPDPHDYVATALAACTIMTLRMYAGHKGWPLEDVHTTVTLDHTRELAKFERVVKLVGPLDPTQRTRLLEIANRCPIHQLLSGKIQIDTRLAE